MNHHLQLIKDQGIPLDALSAGQHLGISDYGIGQQKLEFYLDNIEELTGVRVTETVPDRVRTLYAQLVCAIIRASDNTDNITNIDVILEQSIDKMEQAASRPGFTKHIVSSDTDTDGNVKQKKGAKMELAKKVYAEQIEGKNLSRKDAIAIMVAEGVSTPAGSSTYYAKLKKGEM